MKILVIGSGGREHALAWKCAQSSKVKQVFVAPGNAGTQLEKNITNVDIQVNDIESLLEFAKNNNIKLTIVGPEAPLVVGIVDEFIANGLTIFGPSKNASQLEGSKVFSKNFLLRNNIPSADYKIFNDINLAKRYLQNKTYPVVIKADGLASGKGVVIVYNQTQAFQTVEDILSGNKFGRAGYKIIIEEFLVGEEVSFIVMVDGENILPMATSQDYKARGKYVINKVGEKSIGFGDTSPNTGGMGAYSPAPLVDDKLFAKIINTVIKPTVSAMKREGNPYTGFLYAGLMIENKSNNIKVLEYNCRFGDPETQPIMMRLKSDLVELCLLASKGKLNTIKAHWDSRFALGVVLAANGYPDTYKTNEHIKLPPDIDNTKIFHTGTKLVNDKLLSNGGRVLCVSVLADSVITAQKKAYQIIAAIDYNNGYYRNDIGLKVINS